MRFIGFLQWFKIFFFPTGAMIPGIFGVYGKEALEAALTALLVKILVPVVIIGIVWCLTK